MDEKTFPLVEALLAWNMGGEIRVGPRRTKRAGRTKRSRVERWDSGFCRTWGACNLAVHEATPEQRNLMVMTKFHEIVVHEQVDPVKAHIEFSRIAEFRAIVLNSHVLTNSGPLPQVGE